MIQYIAILSQFKIKFNSKQSIHVTIITILTNKAVAILNYKQSKSHDHEIKGLFKFQSNVQIKSIRVHSLYANSK